MRKYELSLSKDYVPDWTVVDAIRELFQNALDQEETVKDNKMFFQYDGENLLVIGNKKSVLEIRTLLLGSSTKRNDINTIGQFGEGYKIATLVLCRLGKKVTFFNYGNREVWQPRFVKSKRYGDDVLTFFIDKQYPWRKVPNLNLTITIEGITPDEYELIKQSNLHLDVPSEKIETDTGDILLEDRFKQKVFVNGLYVCTYDKYTYGYNFKPQYLKLDRDRKLVDNFMLRWLASTMWSGVMHHELAAKLALNQAADIEYIVNASRSRDNIEAIATQAYRLFTKKYGSNAVPISPEDGKVEVADGYEQVVVKPELSNLIRRSPLYKLEGVVRQLSTRERLQKWIDEYCHELSIKALQEIEAIKENA